MSKQTDVLGRLIGLFNSVFEGDVREEDITMEARLIEDLGMNSIGLLYMAIAVEEEFGVKFTNEDFTALHTVADVVAKIQAC